MKGTLRTLAAALVAFSVNASATENIPSPDFIMVEYARGNTNIVATHHYRALPGSPVTASIDGWVCNASAPTANTPHAAAQWICIPSDSTVSASIRCILGESATMTLSAPGDPPKFFVASIDWRRTRP
jgi:hypothetical protein